MEARDFAPTIQMHSPRKRMHTFFNGFVFNIRCFLFISIIWCNAIGNISAAARSHVEEYFQNNFFDRSWADAWD